MMVFTVSSLSSGCRHCQAHGAYGLDRMGIPVEKIQALWTFESSDLFDDRERAPLRFAVAAGGFMNRYNDSLATVTDEESTAWAAANLGPLGWDIGKHVGAHHEQRTGPPGS